MLPIDFILFIECANCERKWLLNDKSYRNLISYFFFMCFFFSRSIDLHWNCIFPTHMESGSCHVHVHTINTLTRPLRLSDYVATFQQTLHKIYFYWIFQ